MSLYIVPLEEAKQLYPEYTFIKALTPSAQKAAFHVKDKHGNDLCLKLISPNSDYVRVKREIKALSSMNHKNIARLVTYKESISNGNAEQYMIEAFIDGYDFSELIKEAPLDRAYIIDLFSQLCDGLSILNNNKIVHRDLKPSNIRITPDNNLVIIDFGLARHLDLPYLTETKYGARLGTPIYFSPEQVDGSRDDVDHRTDLFALGILLFEASTGIHPFYDGEINIETLFHNIRTSFEYENEQSFTSLPHKWQILIKKLLKKDKSDRPDNAGQVKDILNKIGVN